MKDKSEMVNSRRSHHNIVSSQTSHSSTSRSGVYATTSKRNVMFDSKLDKVPPKKATVQVFDDDGLDVTPRSLLSMDTQSQIGKGSKTGINFNENGSVGTPSELFTQSMFGASTMQASYAAGFSKSIMSSMMGSSRASLDSVTDEISEPSHLHSFAGLQDVERKQADIRENLSPADLKKKITIRLEETDTIWHYDVPGVSVSTSADNATEVREKNERYNQLCANRAGNDMYVQHGIQTFNDAMKTKEIQTNPIGTKEVGCMATNWDMYDTYNVTKSKTEEDPNEDEPFTLDTNTSTQVQDNSSIPSSIIADQSKSIQSYLSESVRSFGTSSSLSMAPGDDTGGISEKNSTISDISGQLSKIMKLESMLENLFIMERLVVQNQYHYRQAAYRGLEEIMLSSKSETQTEPVEETTQQETPKEEIPTKIGPNLSRLWSYECVATKGFTVTCMVWNKQNQDLLAVGYGENGVSNDGRGLACVWSIKNPEYPERIYTLSNAVTSIDFSVSHPNFLALGLFNGAVAVYNIRTPLNESVLDNVDSTGKHSAPVWQLRWIERDKGTGEEKGEVLISASADGRVTQWSIRKGFEYADLMKLKRMTTTKQPDNSSKKQGENTGKKSDALISRFAACMCFDFHNTDGNIYLAGTEEGHIHRCSCSYNEQFLETYFGHKGAVYRTLWSPFDNSFFLSCSSDWTVRLWHVDKPEPVLSFQASTKAIVDIDWSPISSVMFAAITEQQIEIWDLSISTLDPLLVNLPVTKVNLTSVRFALNSEAVLVGDCEGHVTIYQLREMNLAVKHKNDGWLSRVINSALSQNSEDTSNGQTNRSENEDDTNSSNVDR